MNAPDPITRLTTPIRLEYDCVPGVAPTRFLRALAKRRLVGQRHGPGGLVYCPSRGSDPGTGAATDIDVDVADRGTITTFCVVNVPFMGAEVAPPYVAANIVLDGADIALIHLVRECDAGDVHSGMRVEAVWNEGALEPSWDSIRYFRPADTSETPAAGKGEAT